MAESYVQVPLDSTGKKVDTFTSAGGNHRQAIVLADPDTDANVVAIGSDLLVPTKLRQGLDYNTDAGTANTDLVGIALPAAGGPVAGGTATNPIRVDPTGSTTQPVSGPLTDTQLRAVAVPVSAASLPLPTGASTSAKQDTGNTSLASIDTKVPALGQALAAASVPVILPAATITTLTPPAAITNFANETGGNLAAIKAKTDNIPAQGQALAAASLPVVLTAAQITTLTPPAAITGFATESTLDARTGSLTEAAPGTDTASSGLNGRLQRIAQRLTSLIALLPAALGANGGLKIEGVASGTAVPISVATIPSHAVTNAGTFATQVDGAALTALQLIDNPIVDHGSSSVAGTSQIGLAGLSADQTAVTTGQNTRAIASLLGKLVSLPFALPGLTWQYAAATSGIVNTSDVAAKAAAGAGIRNYITGIQVVNQHATVGTEVVVKDGSTVIWRGYCMAAGGGFTANFTTPLRGTANTAVNIACITTGAAVYCNLQGYAAAE